ncbi:MAG: T9SS type A sorting domain-containing protein [Saprospiraceae bacterium]|nr:T9SS type A sorting domain-containing protein [Saprospiraceae bacterium]
MKNFWIFYLFLLLNGSQANAQALGRVTFSSGGTSLANQLPASFGEVFVGGSGQMTMGSQQSSGSGIISTKEPISLLDATLFPNPTTGNLNVHLTNSQTDQGFVNVSTSSGQIISTVKFQGTKFEINTTQLVQGIYYLTISNKQGIPLKTFPFIKQ